MSRRTTWYAPLLGGLALGFLAPHAQALIARPLALRDVVADVPIIVMAKIESIDPEKPAMVLMVDEVLKGKPFFEKRLPVNLTGDKEAMKLKHRDQLLKRVAKNLPLVLFINQKENNYTGFAYINGTWFQMTGSKAEESDLVRWQFTHCEPALRGTYKGKTEDLKQIVIDGLAGKKDPPPPNLKEPPGLGPEIEASDKENNEENRNSHFAEDRGKVGQWAPRPSTSPPLAVIPTVVVGGPLAILAMLFPALFGGLLMVLRRWMALLTVASIDSTLYMLYFWFRDDLPEGWLQSPLALWMSMLVTAVIGTLWAWRRHLAAVQAQAELTALNPADPTFLPFFRSEALHSEAIASAADDRLGPSGLPPLPSTNASVNLLVLAEPPRRGEQIALWIVSALGLGGLLYCLFIKQSLLAQPWSTLLVAWIGIWGGTLYTTYLRLTEVRRSALRTGLPIEGVILALATLAGSALAGSMGSSGGEITTTATTAFAAASQGEHSVRLVGLISRFKSPTKGHLDSSPLVLGDRVFAGFVNDKAFASTGALYCLSQKVDEKSGREQWEEVWRFDDGENMKEIFSSPCAAEGNIFIGEGFHTDNLCKMYCLDAANGRKLWEFPTSSHTESSPCYWEHMLYFGAGDDGMYCLDARTGKKIWNFGSGKLHIDANPTIARERVFCSSGVNGEIADTAYFCLDARTGREVWRRSSNLPVWGSSVVDGDRAYFGLGNHGYVVTDDVAPRGALLCVDADTGEPMWRYEAAGSVLGKPATDGTHVWFGAQDGFVYCLDRRDGNLVWKQDMGGSVLAAPALTRCLACGHPNCLYVVSDAGKLICLNPATGQNYFSVEVMQATGVTPSSSSLPSQFFSSPTVVQTHGEKGERHRIYFGCSPCDDFGYKGFLFCYEAEVQ
jgi:outer membrane protein assembly factor BamB